MFDVMIGDAVRHDNTLAISIEHAWTNFFNDRNVRFYTGM